MSPWNDVGTVILVQTTLVTYTQAFLVGAGYSSIYVSIMYYLQEYFTDHANLYFCLIMSSTSLATFLGSYLLKQFKILRRNFKMTLLVISLLSCLGNLCYSFHSTVWLLMIGRFICGFGDTAPEVVRSEFILFFDVIYLRKMTSKNWFYKYSNLISLLGPPSYISKKENIHLYLYYDKRSYLQISFFNLTFPFSYIFFDFFFFFQLQ